MLSFDVLTLFPNFFSSPLQSSILSIAQKKKLLSIALHDIRDYSNNKHKKVDDYAFGGESGMVIKPEPLDLAIKTLEKNNKPYNDIIFFTPDGEVLDQQMVNNFSLTKNLLLICGHYKGIDERIREKYVTKEVSVGDYVLTGGEIPALIFIDSISRLLPGVLGDETSALNDSFQNNLLSHPVYTRPKDFKGISVPDVLISGNHKKIEVWKREQSLKRTKERRPDLFKKLS